MSLNFYEVDKAYADYLRKIDNRVPHTDYSSGGGRKLLCGIVMKFNSFDYFAPVSSKKYSKLSCFAIQDSKGFILASIRFSFMFPVPHGITTVKLIKKEPDLKYRNLLNKELKIVQSNEMVIYRKAKFVYDAVVAAHTPELAIYCCDFPALEFACRKYIQTQSQVHRHP